MKRLAPLALALVLAACAGGGRPQGPQFNTAQPGEVIAAELAFARLAQERGQWTAFRATAEKQAIMFDPHPVTAEAFLRNRPDPAQSVRWQPHQVWSSCDGSLAVTRGAWQRPNGTTGYFTTVWRRQQDGGYKWVLDQGDLLAQPLPEPEAISASVADCRSGQAIAAAATTGLELPASGGGVSNDFTLSYNWEVATDLSRRVRVSMIKDGRLQDVLDVRVAAPSQ